MLQDSIIMIIGFLLKENWSKDASRALPPRKKNKTDMQQLGGRGGGTKIFFFLCEKFMFESCKNMTTNAAVLCPAVLISDVMNKAGLCGKSIKYIMSQPFSALHW